MKIALLGAMLLVPIAFQASAMEAADEQATFWACSAKSEMSALAGAAKHARVPAAQFMSQLATHVSDEDSRANMFDAVAGAYEIEIPQGVSREEFADIARGDAIGRCMKAAGFSED